MFTGLIEAVGRIERLEETSTGRRVSVASPFGAELAAGDSVAVNGVCLTVVSARRDDFAADLSRETLAVTSFGTMEAGRLVNLERPVRADARMGGHFVLGHVDRTSRIRELRTDGDGYWLDVELPTDLARYVVPKGSIAVDGISLTIASLSRAEVGIQIVPFTREHTSLREAAIGDRVNLEADVLGKYVARILAIDRANAVVSSPLELRPL
jgi:riboflavin synthase